MIFRAERLDDGVRPLDAATGVANAAVMVILGASVFSGVVWVLLRWGSR